MKPHHLLSLLLLITTALTHAEDFTYNGLTYTILTDSTCETRAGVSSPLKAGNSVSGELVIPNIVYNGKGNAYTVVKIGEYAFEGCSSLASVSIPESVTSIGANAFFECRGLISLNIPNSVIEIGERAFLQCRSLASVVIPNSVTTIGENAFSYCEALTTISIPNSITTINHGVFSACSDCA